MSSNPDHEWLVGTDGSDIHIDRNFRVPVEFDCAHTMAAKEPDGLRCCDCGRLFRDRADLERVQHEQESQP